MRQCGRTDTKQVFSSLQISWEMLSLAFVVRSPPTGPPTRPPPLCGEDKEGGQGRIADITGQQGTLHCSCLEHCFLLLSTTKQAGLAAGYVLHISEVQISEFTLRVQAPSISGWRGDWSCSWKATTLTKTPDRGRLLGGPLFTIYLEMLMHAGIPLRAPLKNTKWALAVVVCVPVHKLINRECPVVISVKVHWRTITNKPSQVRGTLFI